MRKLHKKYIVLNVFLIIYIMSLSVGYAYFSESIQATGTAKTLEYSNMPLFFYQYDQKYPTSDSFAGNSGYYDYFEFDKVLHPSYDVYEVYHTMDYSMAVDDEVFSDNSIGEFILNFYILKTVNVPVTDYTITVQDLTNMVASFDTIKLQNSNYQEYDTAQSLWGYTYYGRDSAFLKFRCNGDFGGMSPNPKKILVNISFTSQGKSRNLKIYYIINYI